MFAVSPFRRGRYLLVGIILVTYFIFRQAPRSWTTSRGSIPTSHGEFFETSPLELPHLLHTEVAIPKTKLRVAVLEHAGFHDGQSSSVSSEEMLFLTPVSGSVELY